MRAEPLLDERHVLSETTFAEIVVWRVPAPVRGSAHRFRYRLALVVEGTCVLRYDNEPGKGDHRHIGEKEGPYSFSTPEQLLADFWTDVNRQGL
ncbi:MAG: toxin-antitoxin system TumE family protein [Burkholderiales bacterium]